MALAVRRETAVVLVERGMSIPRHGMAWRVLAPGRRNVGLSLNDRSLVLLVGEPPARVLIPGDLEAAGERWLLEQAVTPRAELLVLGHHGSRDATSADFLEAVAPRHVVASCGFRNRFGHPDVETLTRIEAAGASVWRTDLHGTLRFAAGPPTALPKEARRVGDWRVRATRR